MWHPARHAHLARFAQPRVRLGLAGLAAVLLVGSLVFSLVVAPATHASSTTFTVTDCTSANASGATLNLDTALADAQAQGESGDTITFNCSGDIVLDQTLNITSTLTIDGRSGSVGVDGGNALQDITVSSTGTLTLDGLTVQKGTAGSGSGGGISNAGTLSLNGSHVVLNTTAASAMVCGIGVEDGGGIYNTGMLSLTNSTVNGNTAGCGGGIANLGTLTLTNGTVANNQATSSGGGIFNENGGTLTLTNGTVANNQATSSGGGIFNAGTLTLTNSTVANNSAQYGFGGGGIYNSGTLTLTNSTVANNSAQYEFGGGGGIYNQGGPTKAGTLTLTNSTVANNTGFEGGGILNQSTVTSSGSIVADNTAPQGNNCSNEADSFTDGGYNLEYPGTDCGFGTGPGSVHNTDPKLDPNGLQDNGGPTQTIALQADSPASDQMPAASCPQTDQRGVARPDNGEAACDIGAYEFVASTSVTICDTAHLDAALATVQSGDTLKFGCDGTIGLDQTLTISSTLTLDGNGHTVALDGGNALQDITVSSTGTLTLDGLTIQKGTAGSGSGGGISNAGTLTLTNSTVANNQATYGGGIFNAGTLTLTNSTVANNTGFEGGGIFNAGTLTLTNSTVANNQAASVFGLGGGILNGNGGTVTSSGSLLAGNTYGGVADNCDNSGTISDGGYNLESGTDCGFSAAHHSLSNTDPKFVTDGAGHPLLADNGGPTQTIALQAGSPAIDQMPAASCPATDPRGVTRPDNGEVACDIGAYETAYPAASTSSLSPLSAAAGSSSFTLKVSGANFAAGVSQVNWNGASLNGGTYYRQGTPVTSGLADEIDVPVPTSDLSKVGTVYVTVVTGGPGGETSNAQVFYVTPTGTGVTATTVATSTSAGGTATAEVGGSTVGASGSLAAAANGQGTVAVAQYTGNPETNAPTTAVNAYFDVNAAAGSSFSSVTITDCNLGGGSVLYYWTGSTWAQVATQTYTAGPPPCVTATITSTSLLSGTPFAVADQPPALTLPAHPVVMQGVAGSIAISARDPEGEAVTLSATGLPAGLRLGATTCAAGVCSATISGTATAAPGSYTATITARESDGSGASTSQSLTINVDTNLSGYPKLSTGAYNLSNARLGGAYLAYLNLAGANANQAALTSANLTGANLSNANLSQANLSGANLSQANLSGANLSQANLKGVTGMSSATLTHVTWQNTTCPDGTSSTTDGGTCVGHF